MKKKLILIFVILSSLSGSLYVAILDSLYYTENILYYVKLQEALEYTYDFTSSGTLFSQFENLGFEFIGTEGMVADRHFGFTKVFAIAGAKVDIL